jgi:hypothetical protein
MAIPDTLDRLGDRLRPRAGWPRRLGAALVATAGFWLTSGTLGLAVGAALALVAIWGRGWTAFALGQIALVALLPQGGPLAQLLVVEAGLFGLLVGDARPIRELPRVVLETAAITGALGGLAWVAWRWLDAILGVALLVVAAIAVAAYALHRYERLHLGYLDPEDHRERH